MRRRVLLAAPACLGAALARADEPRPGRTCYDRLPLGSPGEAAATFVATYLAADYAAVWLILDPTAQRTVAAAIDVFSFDKLVSRISPALMREAAPPPEDWEQTDYGGFFDALMLAASRHDALPIAPLAGAATRVAGNMVEWPGVRPLTLRMTRSHAGKWRVAAAVPAERDAGRLPWGLPVG